MIRKANIQDLDSIFELVKAFATSFNPQKELFIKSFIDILNDKKAVVYVAESDERIIGYLLGFIHDTFLQMEA